jgi:hypothetical protein
MTKHFTAGQKQSQTGARAIVLLALTLFLLVLSAFCLWRSLSFVRLLRLLFLNTLKLERSQMLVTYEIMKGSNQIPFCPTSVSAHQNAQTSAAFRQ